MTAKRCACGKWNPETAQRCDCGFDFVTQLPAPRQVRLPHRRGRNWISRILWAMAGYLIFTEVVEEPGSIPDGDLPPYLDKAGTIVASAVLATTASAFDAWSRNVVQEQRDAAARILLDAILSDTQHPRFFLYLRPFAVTGRMAEEPAFPNPLYQAPQQDLEEHLADALLDHGFLISLGETAEALGASRFPVSESAWKDRVLAYLRKAALLFVIPGHQDGTRWEMEQILAQGYLSKTVFVTPVGDSDAFKAKAHWERTRTDWQEKLNLRLPKYAAHQCFQLDTDGTVCNSLSLRKLASRPEIEALVRTARVSRAGAWS